METILLFNYGASTEVILHIQVEKWQIPCLVFLCSSQYLRLFLSQNLFPTLTSGLSVSFPSALGHLSGTAQIWVIPNMYNKASSW